MKTKLLKRVSVVFLAILVMLSSMSLSSMFMTTRADEDQTEVVTEAVAETPVETPAAEAEAPSDPGYVENTQEFFDVQETAPEAALEDITTADETATEAEKETEEDKEVTYPAASFSGAAGGVEVFVSADEGTFPEGTTMTVIGVSASQVYDTVNAAVAGEVTNVKAVDITFYGPDGQEVQPLKAVHMTMNVPGMNQSADRSVVHIGDNGAADVLTNATVVGDSAYVEACSFSIYLVVGTDQQPTDQNAVATYEFYVEDELVMTQYIKTGDKLTDPGTSVVNADAANTVFKGWFIGNTAVDFDTAQTVDETKTIRVDAKIEHTYYVTFWGEADDEGNRGIVAVKSVTVEGSGSGEVTISDVSVTPKADTSAFKGWSEEETGTETITNDSVTVNDRKDLYAVVVDAYWLHFYENDGGTGGGASYTGPVFIAETDVRSSKKPADPTRKGYTFGGWYLDADCTQEFDWTATGLEKDTDLYAKWIPGVADLKVVIWKQKVTDSKDAADDAKTYDFEASADYTGTTGETVNLNDFNMYKELNYEGFHYRTMEASSETIKADGTTVINVYYDRNLMTIDFVDGSHTEYVEATDNRGTQFGLVNGEYVQLSYDRWYDTWSYTVSGTYSGTDYYHRTYDNSGTQYGVVDGQLVQLTRSNGTWYANGEAYYGDRYKTGESDWGTTYGIVDGELTALDYDWWSGEYTYRRTIIYTDTRYKLATVPTKTTFTGLYGQTLTANGYTWPSEKTWYQNPNSGGTRLTFLDAFKFEGLSGVSSDGTVLTQYSGNAAGDNRIRFYKQNIDGTYPDNPTNTVNSTNNSTFTVTEKYEGFTAARYENNNGSGSISAGESVGTKNLKLYFTRNKYTLTFMSDGANVGTKNGIPYEQVISGYKIDDPTKEHYNFQGWYEDIALQQPVDWNAKMPAANKAVYAKWTPKQYHVSLDPNGGEFQNAQVAEFNITYGSENDTLNKDSLFKNVTKDKHELIGWFYKNADGSVGEVYEFGKIESDVNLIAKWRYPGQVQIVYDASPNGSGAPKDNYKYATDSSVVLGAPPETVNTGYAFVGWSVGGKKYYTNNTFDITESLIEDYDPTTKTGTVTVKAIYQELGTGALTPTTITYNANGGTGDDVVIPVDPDKLLINQPVIAKSADECGFTRDGYEFTGWNTMKDGTGLDVAADDDIAADLRNLEKNTDINTLYAQWELIKYTVVYTDGVDDETIFADETHNDLTVEDPTPEFNNGTDPTREGYDFKGWDPEVKDKVSADDADEDNVITYTATWAEKEIEIKYVASTGGSVDPASETVKVVTGTIAGSTATAAEGYEFVNWTDADGNEVGTDAKFVPANKVEATYTANFKEKEVVITYEASTGGSVDPASETVKVVTGTIAGSTATPADGYEFVNWTDADGNEVGTDAKFVPTDKVAATYTANFQEQVVPKTATITYDLNGGIYNGSTENIVETHEVGEEITIHEAPTREGYEFDYWKGSEYQPGDKYTVEGDHTFEAQWKKAAEPEDETTKPDDGNKPSGGSEVKTGDSNNIYVYAALLFAALVAIVFALRKLRGQNK